MSGMCSTLKTVGWYVGRLVLPVLWAVNSVGS